ncbi:MAG: IS1380 family transposase, partial [Propionibacteriaceae bacterium]
TLGKARTATVRRTLIQVAGRIANQARRWRLHLPARWPWQDELDAIYTAALGPPALTAS